MNIDYMKFKTYEFRLFTINFQSHSGFNAMLILEYLQELALNDVCKTWLTLCRCHLQIPF